MSTWSAPSRRSRSVAPGDSPVTTRHDIPGSQLPEAGDRNLTTRERALVAGLHVLLHHTEGLLTDGLHRKRLAAISGQSRQTFYQHFPDHSAYLDEMFGLLLDPEDRLW